jgi:hypothetical protein
MTVGKKSPSAVMEQVEAVERWTAAQVTGGTYEPSYGVWRVPMTGGRATVSMTPAGGPVPSPIFRFSGFTGTAVSSVTLDGQPTQSYFASVDGAARELWLTLNGTVVGPVTIQVE